MKIKDIRCVRVHGILDEPIGIGEDTWLSATEASADPFREWRPDGHRNLRATFLEISTDDRITGLSRTLRPDDGRLICHELAPRLIGRDPRDVETIWDDLRSTFGNERWFRNDLLLMVDMALWDICGKAAGTSVFRLLNGKSRAELPVYASTVGCSLASRKLRDRARALKADGFPAQKWFFKFAPDSGDKGKQENIRMVRRLRAALDDGYPLMLDATFGWSEDYAEEMLREIAGYGPCWLEDPVGANQWDVLKRLRACGKIPIASGDTIGTCEQLREVLDKEAIDIFQPDEGALGGITPMMRAAAICREYGVPFVPHCGDMATMHVLAAHDEALCPWFEYLVLWFRVGQWFYKQRYMPGRGAIRMPTTPGVGIELDEARIVRREEIL